MNLGKLDTPFELLRNTGPGVNAFGEPEAQWSVVEEGLCQREQVSGRAFLNGESVTTTRKAVFRMHYIPGATPDDLIRVDGALFNIHEVRPLGRERYCEIHAEGYAGAQPEGLA